MVATSPVTLAEEGDDRSSFLIARPIYRSGSPLETLDNRRENLLGYAVGFFRVGDMLESSLKDLTVGGMDFQVFDDGSPDDGFLYFHQAGVRRLHQPSPSGAEAATELQGREALNLPGRQWSLLFSSTARALGVHTIWWEWIVLSAGLAATALLAAYLINSTRYTARIEGMAVDLSKANEDLQQEMVERRRAEQARYDTLNQTALALAHHVRNSVTPILGLAQLYNEDDPGQGAKLRDTALEKGRRISAIVDALIEIAESGDVRTVDAYGSDSRKMLDMERLIERYLERSEEQFRS